MDNRRTDCSRTDSGRMECGRTDRSRTDSGRTECGRTDSGRIDNGGMLWRYEMKKLLGRRALWIMMGLCLLCLVFCIIVGRTDIDGGGGTLKEYYGLSVAQREARETVSGRKIDQTLLEEMCAAYQRIPSGQLREGSYEKTEEYLTYAMPYCEVFALVRTWTGMDFESAVFWEPSQEKLYRARRDMVESRCRALGLSEEQRAFWMEKESQLPAPMTYVSHDAYFMIIVVGPMTALFLMLVVAVGMSGMFAQERSRGTDQIILACPGGRGRVYWTKLLAGLGMAALCALLLAAAVAGSAFLVYGAGGYEAPLQFFCPYYAYPLTMGQACLILAGLFFLTALLDSVFVMALSELTGSARATFALAVGSVWLGELATIVIWKNPQMPQLWHYVPLTGLFHLMVFDLRPITLFGHSFVVWQGMPVIYLFYGILAALAGRVAYGRHQVRRA